MNKLEEQRVILWREVYVQAYAESLDRRLLDTEEPNARKRRHRYATVQAGYATTLFSQVWQGNIK